MVIHNINILNTGSAVLFLVLFFPFSVLGQTTTHQVKNGETLYSIAQQYDATVKQLREWNNLESNTLSTDQILVVEKRSATDTKQDSLIHTVQTQETLFSISKKYNVSIAELKSWNNLENNNLNVGQELRIFPSQSRNQESKFIAENSVKTERNAYYSVKSGDSLYGIAKQHNMTVDELKELNGLTSNNIRVGQQLTVRRTSSPPSIAETADSSPQGKFISYRIDNEGLQQILKRFQMDEAEFRSLNPDIDPESINSGQQITVLAPPNRRYENPYRANTGLQDLGTATVSRYSESEKGKPTTNGELYNPQALTAAHSNISMGTVLFVQNPDNNQGVYIRINDRISGSGLKLSETAWNALQFNRARPTVNIYQD